MNNDFNKKSGTYKPDIAKENTNENKRNNPMYVFIILEYAN